MATRYRYYVSAGLHHGTAPTGSRIPALEIERTVCGRLAEAVDDPLALAATIGIELGHGTGMALIERAPSLAARLHERHHATVAPLIAAVRVGPLGVVIEMVGQAVADALGVALMPGAPATSILTIAVTLTRTGRAMRLVRPGGSTANDTPNPAAVKLAVKARRWWRRLREGELTISELAATEKVSPAYVTRVLRLAFQERWLRLFAKAANRQLQPPNQLPLPDSFFA